MKIPLIEYLEKSGISRERVIHRYVQVLKMLHIFIKDCHFSDDMIKINSQNLVRAIVDYFVDSVRIKEFHDIKHTNREKIYGYTTYWLLKRKPIQVLKNFKGCEFVNEYFITVCMIALILRTKDISDEAKKDNPSLEKFRSMLFYNLKFRLVTQQSIELMIDAFFSGYDFTQLSKT